MLRIAPKGGVAHAEYLTLEQDRIMRSAFGRYSAPATNREAAIALVRHYQQLGPGHWFLCDCRPDMPRPPALVPVMQTHIRRHQDERWPVHWPGCDFERDPGEQREITASYARPSPEKPMRLVQSHGIVSDHDKLVTTRHSQHDRRPGVARLVMRLVSSAGLQRINPGWRPPSLVDQVKALWAASRKVEIDAGVMLPSYFCTSPAKLDELRAKVAEARPGCFTRSRPHGVLVTRVAQVDSRVMIPVSGAPIPVRGRLAVFGEEAGSASVQQAEGTVRAPYLAACVVGRAAPEEPVEVLSAYVHPIAGVQHLMLVDSDLERHTLAQLRSVQTWLGDRKQVAVTIEKPVFDVGTDSDLDRPTLIPDFVVTAEARGSDPVVVVGETMGFADLDYRARKARTHLLMATAMGAAGVVEHDFHQPTSRPQKWRDDRFWQDMRHRLEGSRAGSRGINPTTG